MKTLIIILIQLFLIQLSWSQTPTLGKLLPSLPAIKYNLAQGTYNPRLDEFVVTNISSVPIHLKQSFPKRPNWIDTSLNENLITLGPGQVMGVGVGVNVMNIEPGNYSTTYVLTGDFINSPLIIPVELTVTMAEKLIVSSHFVTYGAILGEKSPAPFSVHFINPTNKILHIKTAISKQQIWLLGENEISFDLKPEDTKEMKVLIDSTKLTQVGTYSATLTVTGNFTNSPYQTAITLKLLPAFKSLETK